MAIFGPMRRNSGLDVLPKWPFWGGQKDAFLTPCSKNFLY